MLQLFDSKSSLMAALGELLDWFLLSLLTWICSVPVITAGPAWAALYGVMSNRIGDNSPCIPQLSHPRQALIPSCAYQLAALFYCRMFFVNRVLHCGKNAQQSTDSVLGWCHFSGVLSHSYGSFFSAVAVC